MELGKEILKSIQIITNRTLSSYKADRTYQSVIKKSTPEGYIVLDEAGNERTVPCCIPGLELKEMQKVWIKEPMGKLGKLHICGVAGK